MYKNMDVSEKISWMRSLVRLILFTGLLLTACTAAPGTPPSLPPAGTIAPEETLPPAPPGEGIIVENLDLLIMESFPVQVNALVRGSLPDACTFIEGFQQVREGNEIKIRLKIARRPEARCAPQPTPFEQLIPLDVLGLPAGRYTVEVHGVRSSFELAVDNAPPPVEEPGGWNCGDYGRPDPCNNWLFGVDMLSETEAWAVGLNGTILHWQGGEWSKATSPVTESLRAIKMISPDEGWIAGEAGDILRWDGETWTLAYSPSQEPSGNQPGLLALDMYSPENGWAVGFFGLMLHWDGNQWKEVPPPLQLDLLQGVAMAGENDAWAVGATPEGQGIILRWDGSVWSEVSSPTDQIPQAIDILTPEDVWVVGRGGTILHWDGQSWSSVSSPTSGLLTSIAILSPTEGWISGMDESGSALLLIWDGSAWSPVSPPEGLHGLSWISAASAQAATAVGENGVILAWDGNTWTKVTGPSTTETLIAVDMLNPMEGWAVSGSGFLRWDGKQWAQIASPAAGLAEIAMVSPREGWAVGRGGVILYWDGSIWSLVKNSPTTQDLTAIAMPNGAEGWAVGAAGTILRWDGELWTVFPSPTDKFLFAVEMISPQEGWIGGEDILLHWDGQAWQEFPTPLPTVIQSVSMVSPSDGWAVGAGGVILHWDGAAWTPVESQSTSGEPVMNYLYAVDMLDPNDGWIAGEMGILLHWDGKEWREFPSMALPTGSLLDLEMLSPSEGWAVGGATSLGEFSTLVHFSKD